MILRPYLRIAELEGENAALRVKTAALQEDLAKALVDRESSQHRDAHVGVGYVGDPMLPGVEPDPTPNVHRSCAAAAARVCVYCAPTLGVGTVVVAG